MRTHWRESIIFEKFVIWQVLIPIAKEIEDIERVNTRGRSKRLLFRRQ